MYRFGKYGRINFHFQSFEIAQLVLDFHQHLPVHLDGLGIGQGLGRRAGQLGLRNEFFLYDHPIHHLIIPAVGVVVDQIIGFDVGENDAIDISDILTGYTSGVSDINDFVNLTTSGSNTILSVDANGLTGGASFTDIVQINDFAGITVEALLANSSLIPV